MTKKNSVGQNQYLIREGILIGAKQCPSPNCNERPFTRCADAYKANIELLVIHNISLPAGCFVNDNVEQFFLNTLDTNKDQSLAVIKDLQVSAHLFINRLGDVTQFVNFNHRAWHAGISSYNNRDNCNDFSIGIELEGTDFEPFEEVQYKVLAQVSRALQIAYPKITTASVTGHSDIAPIRKTDPGPFFEWQKYKKMWSESNSD
ncbi:1,6-anhydro-N-acetylmuramyl-L-alanine amidase AmpD [Gammaproteobacteria bacterium AS21]